MTTTDQIRSALRDLEARAKEMELDKKLTTFADQADQFLRAAATRAGEYAAENRDRVETTLDKAGAKVDEKTDGKYHSYVGKVRAGVLTGVDWVAEQRAAADRDAASSTASAPAGEPTTSFTAPEAGSADSAAWVDVTDAPPSPTGHDPRAEGSTDPR